MRKKGRHYTEKYLLNRRGYVRNYILPEFGEVQPATITRREIDNWLLDLKNPAGRELAGEKENKIMYTMSLIFEELVDLNLIEANPITGIKPYNKSPLKPRGTTPRESLEMLYPTSHGGLVWVWGSCM
ncbi:MAG: hypothetical protein LBD93_09920 [Treponema sp.]|jgi:hypothetical protein|nr:hypothetical protein [Treponema sp.]